MALVSKTRECDATIYVTFEGARVVCACGRWESHPAGEASFESRRDVMARWYEHFVARARARARVRP